MKFKNFIILISLVLIFGSSAMGAYYGNIPQKTLQIAREASAGGVNIINTTQSKTVRVAIGTTGFSSYVWENASIYTTGNFDLYNKKTLIGNYDSQKVVNIKMVGKIFVLTDENDDVIEKVSGPIRFVNNEGFIGIKGLKRAGVDAQYRGDIELVCPSEGKFHIINSIDVESYLKGVVPNEMPVRFGLEALKAQTVAARNYVLSPRIKSNPNYDVVDSVASQVYFGANTEKMLSNRAVDETYGIVALYNWDLILALYSSTAGGYTESYSNAFSEPYTKVFPAQSKPYLIAVPDYEEYGYLNTDQEAERYFKSKPKSFDINSPYYRWEREWTIDELQTEIQNHIAAQSDAGFVHPCVNKGEIIDRITDVNVISRGFSGKIIKLEIKTQTKTYTVEKELVIRRLFTNKGKALPSANFVFNNEYDENGNLSKIKIYGSGFGHGVGLSQYGAGFMGSELKMTYDKILKHYYKNITLGTVPFILSSNTAQNYYSQNFYTDDKKAYLVVDNKYKVDYLDLKINGVDEKICLNPDQRLNKIDLSKYLQRGLNAITFYYPISLGQGKGLRIYIEVGQDE